MNYEQLFMALSFSFTFILGMVIGGVIASRWGIYLKISKKEDYEEKLKNLEQLLEQMQHPEPEKGPEYNPSDFFAPGISPDYGLPRKLK